MKRIFVILIFMLLISTVLPVSAEVIFETNNNSKMLAKTLYVGSGPGKYAKIQDAINDAVDGDTVFVYNDLSPYYENILVNKSINLIGEDKETTVIDGNKNGNVVYVITDMVTIDGFTIMNSKNSNLNAGVNIYANFTTISNNIIKNNYIGIAIWNNYDYVSNWIFNENVISDNIIISNTLEGIWLETCKYTKITNNIISNNSYHGIYNIYSSYNTISGNKISDNDIGISVYQNSNFNKISNNNITNNYDSGISLFDSGINDIYQNNFIENKIRNVKLVYYLWNVRRNKWDGNYWGEPKTMPHIISGKLSFLLPFGVFPWFEIDWHPANEPYDITY